MQKNRKIAAIQISTTAKSTKIGLGWASYKKNNCHPEHDQSGNYWHNQSAMETFDETHSCSKSQLCGCLSTNERAAIVDQWEVRDLSRQNFTPPPTSQFWCQEVPSRLKASWHLNFYELMHLTFPVTLSLFSSSKSLKIQILSYSLNACLAVRFIAKNGDFEKPENSLKNTQSLSETLLMFFWLTKWTNCELIGLPFREG